MKKLIILVVLALGTSCATTKDDTVRIIIDPSNPERMAKAIEALTAPPPAPPQEILLVKFTASPEEAQDNRRLDDRAWMLRKKLHATISKTEIPVAFKAAE